MKGAFTGEAGQEEVDRFLRADHYEEQLIANHSKVIPTTPEKIELREAVA